MHPIQLDRVAEVPQPSFDDQIPVIDMADFYNTARRHHFIEGLKRAFQKFGFVAVVNAPIEMQILDKAYQAAVTFFRLPLESKREIKSSTNSGERGYVDTESPKGQNQVVSDYKEFLHMGRELSEEAHTRLGYPKNLWPKSGALQKEMMAFYESIEKLVEPFSEAIAEAAGIPSSFLRDMTHEGDHLLRAVHYPKNPPPGEFWAASHTDINFFTMIPKATADGLQVELATGQWIDAQVPDRALLVNVGDMLQNLTNGLFRSSVHRVICKQPNVERFSLVFFAHAHRTDRMDPLDACIVATGGKRKYPLATRQELLEQRIVEMGRASFEMIERLSRSGLLEQEEALGLDCSKAREILKKQKVIQ